MNASPTWMQIGLLSGVVAGVIGVSIFLVGPPAAEKKPLRSEVATLDASNATVDRVVVGGIARPSSDISSLGSPRKEDRVPVKKRQGFSPAVAPDSSESVAQLARDLASRETPNAFSSFAPPSVFDANAYRADPQAYLSAIEPGRVFVPAQPGEGVPPIRSEGKRFHRLKQGESVRLKVAASPGAPVAFASQDLGQFENSLTSITIAANEEGVAEAVYTASGGTIDLVQVLAASPMASGQVQFTIDVAVP
jgi:hypothetical protein